MVLKSNLGLTNIDGCGSGSIAEIFVASQNRVHYIFVYNIYKFALFEIEIYPILKSI